ncbi:hypothetical protein ACH4U6_12595 [Streptomyces netropsis]|uniref:Uncharacterized protein n=1 Tax=Streptomyces netropsis TaxID=55404 RepID=A0A7W7PI18_STRNE|nr:hypothetical protein [Streptomyces netropsis]MBB4890614.1 hypothetical protein [Streptomyces netropsis]GGR49896.1 hypothetical protein GCM10010219_64010 [Streptomyces netropsis]
MADRDKRGPEPARKSRGTGRSTKPLDRAEGSETDEERRRRRAQFLRELNEAKELRDRVQPRRARAARMRQQMRMRTFRW